MKAWRFNAFGLLNLSLEETTKRLIPAGDAAGIVVAFASGVTRFSVGDRVIAIFEQRR